jgi:hypothetical protein
MLTRPALVLAGDPTWRGTLETLLDRLGFSLIHYAEQPRYVARLADDHAAMIVIDGDADWRFWVVTPKVSPATRRIPVVLVAADAAARREAPAAGADFTLSPGELPTRLPDLLAGHARVQRESVAARLRSQCHEPLPPRARQAIELFNAGEYYRQHDLFEELWIEEQGPVRDLYRATLQIGVAYYQVTRGNRRGALKMLLRSVQWLNALPDVCRGVNVARLRQDALRVRAALERMPPDADLASFDRALLRPVALEEG